MSMACGIWALNCESFIFGLGLKSSGLGLGLEGPGLGLGLEGLGFGLVLGLRILALTTTLAYIPCTFCDIRFCDLRWRYE